MEHNRTERGRPSSLTKLAVCSGGQPSAEQPFTRAATATDPFSVPALPDPDNCETSTTRSRADQDHQRTTERRHQADASGVVGQSVAARAVLGSVTTQQAERFLIRRSSRYAHKTTVSGYALCVACTIPAIGVAKPSMRA